MQIDTLLIMAHPDDAAIFCGGSIIQAIKNNKKCHVLSITSLPEPQKSDLIKKSFDILGVTYSVLEYESTSKVDYAIVKKSIIQKILKCSPDKIITHWEKDSHPGHILTFKLVLESIQSVSIANNGKFPKELYCCDTYWSWGYDRTIFQPTEFIDISSCWLKKIEAIKAYNDQWETTWLKMVDITNRLNGYRCGVNFAEAFLKYSCFVALGGGEKPKYYL